MNEATKCLSALLVLAALSSASARAFAQGAARRLDVSAAVSEALARNPARQAAEIGVERARQNVLAEQGRYTTVL